MEIPTKLANSLAYRLVGRGIARSHGTPVKGYTLNELAEACGGPPADVLEDVAKLVDVFWLNGMETNIEGARSAVRQFLRPDLEVDLTDAQAAAIKAGDATDLQEGSE